MKSVETMIRSIFIAGVLFLALSGCAPKSKVTLSDHDLNEHFFKNESCYEILNHEITYRGIYRIELATDELEFMPAGSIPENKRVYIFNLMSECLNVSLINAWINDANEVYEVSFYNLRKGFVFGGKSKGIAYLLTPPAERTRKDLDLYEAGLFEEAEILQGRVYKKIKDNWYMFFDYSD